MTAFIHPSSIRREREREYHYYYYYPLGYYDFESPTRFLGYVKCKQKVQNTLGIMK